jgi:hypothetical protein
LALTLVTVASRRAREEQPHSEVVAFYDKLLPIISHEIFKKGEWVYLDVWGTGTATLLERSPQHAHLASSAHSPPSPKLPNRRPIVEVDGVALVLRQGEAPVRAQLQ